MSKNTKSVKKLSQTKYAKRMRAMRRNETPEAKATRLAHRRALMEVYRYRQSYGRIAAKDLSPAARRLISRKSTK